MSKVPLEQKSQLVDPRETFTRRVIACQNTYSSVRNTVEILFAVLILLCPYLDVKGIARQNTYSSVRNTVEILFAVLILLCPYLDVKGILRTEKSAG